MMDLLGMDILQRILKKAPDISYKKSNMGTVLHTCHPGQEQHSACLIHPLSVCQSNTTKLNNYNYSILINTFLSKTQTFTNQLFRNDKNPRTL